MNWQQSLNGFPLPHGQSPAVSKYATLCTSVAYFALYNEILLQGNGIKCNNSLSESILNRGAAGTTKKESNPSNIMYD